ncbi:MAG TPA: hypothetical protein VKB50_06765 [Vicinamibacterales bacterium]|nr:hypothetical protein [Vicinamibacterales bacterium]
MRVWSVLALAMVLVSTDSHGQTPQPFPKPGQASPQKPATPPPAPVAQPAPPPAAAKPQASTDPNVPSAATLYFPVYPSAQMVGSYDAGRGQRYYLFGSTAPFADVVTYYRTQLDERGTLVFKEPPTHMFEIGRFREETMAFPPGVTVKDWTWGSQGYPNPKLRAQPARFPTIILIVPPPSPAAQPVR